MTLKRIRDYGISVGELPTGALNHLVDVPGVRVGHVTLNPETGMSAGTCTGVTAILPHGGNWFRDPRPAVTHIINGFGKSVGTIQVDELGYLESPVLLTNTLSVPAVAEGAVRYLMSLNSEIGEGPSVNVVVGECNDSCLNDMRGLHVRPEHAILAIEAALNHNDCREGAVGAGTGMVCFGWKGGVGSASRVVGGGDQAFTVGVLVVSNFGSARDLMIAGHPVGRWVLPSDTSGTQSPDQPGPAADGSIMLVLATNLPFTTVGLRRMAKRAVVGLARVGSIVAHGSGDIVVAFTTEKAPTPALESDGHFISTCFRAVAEAVEEAVLNSLTAAETTVGKSGRVIQALPMEAIVDRLRLV